MFESDGEAYGILQRILDRIQSSGKLRRTLGVLLFLFLLGLVIYFIAGLLPQKYTLTVSGGPLLTNRHHLVRILQREAEKYGLTLNIVPYSGSMEILQAVSDGDLDLAVIQGGMNRLSPNVAHVAALPSETVHLLVKEPIDSIGQLRGKSVNLGSTGGGTRLVVRNILSFFGLNAGLDYVEKNNADERLYDLSPDQLPDAIAVVSYVPSYLADYLINQCGYTLASIPLSDSLGWRYIWAEPSQILDCTYSATRIVPSGDLETVGVKPEIIANEFADPGAIEKFLEVLYNSSIKSVIRQPIQEENDGSDSLYPLSAGTEAYMRRNDPIFSMDALDDVKNVFGSLMAGLSTLLVVFRWFKGGKKNKKEEENGAETSAVPDPEKPDDEGKMTDQEAPAGGS